MDNEENVNVRSIESVARMLADEHMMDDACISEVYWAPHETEVRLVDVTSSISDSGEVLPFRFAEDLPDVPYKFVVIMLSPADWKRRSELEWPSGYESMKKIR